jgi:hypothetical protein
MRIAAISFTIAAVVGIATLLGGDGGYEEERIAGSAALISAMALIATPGAVLLDQRGRSALWSAVGGLALLFSVLTLFVGLFAIWGDVGDDEEGIWVIVVVAVAASHTSLLTIGRRDGDSAGVGTLISLTIAAGVVIGILVSGAILADSDSEGFGRAIAAFGILDALGLVLIPIARRLQRDPAPAAAGTAGGLGQALGLDRSSGREGRVWDLDAAGFDSVLERARGLGVDPLLAAAPDRGRMAVLREGDSVVVLVTGSATGTPPAA